MLRGVKYSFAANPQVKPNIANREEPKIMMLDLIIALFFTRSGSYSIINLASASSFIGLLRLRFDLLIVLSFII